MKKGVLSGKMHSLFVNPMGKDGVCLQRRSLIVSIKTRILPEVFLETGIGHQTGLDSLISGCNLSATGNNLVIAIAILPGYVV